MKRKVLTYMIGFIMTINMGSVFCNALEGQDSSEGFKSITYYGGKSTNPDEVLKNFMTNKGILAGSKKSNYLIKSKKVHENGSILYKIQQNYDSIPVFGYQKNILMDENTTIKTVTGWDIPYIEKTNEDSTKKCSTNEAKNIAIADLNLGYSKEMKHSSKKVMYVIGNKGYYCYLIRVNFLKPRPGNWYYFIDCYNGKIILKYNNTDSIIVENTGIGVNGESKNIKVTKTASNKNFSLKDTTRGKGIITYNAYNDTQIPGFICTDTDGVWDLNSQKAAVDAHYYAELTYDFYKKYFGRNSYDDKGAAIISTVHYQKNFANAFWDGSQMIYGDGDGRNLLPISGAIDVVAHELTHAVTENEVGLIYQNQSGAINESLSDIFATLIEFEQGIKADWLIGEDICTSSIKGGALRSLANPTMFGDPDHYSRRFVGNADNGGVHKNSGIINKAGFLISEGGTNYGVSVEGIGRKKLGAILYRSVCYYLTPNATFSLLRASSVQSAQDLYGKNSKEVNTVKKAFEAVGILK